MSFYILIFIVGTPALYDPITFPSVWAADNLSCFLSPTTGSGDGFLGFYYPDITILIRTKNIDLGNVLFTLCCLH